MSTSVRWNICPACGEIAVTPRERLTAMKLLFPCMQCRISLRQHPLATALAILILGLGILLPYIYFGLAWELAYFSVASVLLYFTIMWLAPLQVNPDEDHPSEPGKPE